jgi:hypothetical protein
MGAIEIFADLSTSGPVFDGAVREYVSDYLRQVEDVIGDEAVTRIRAYLPTQYLYIIEPSYNEQAPPDAGRYQASITSSRIDFDSVMVTDGGVVYGPWLEGIATGNLIIYPHRFNPPPRRFPGYHAFRIIGEQLDMEATAIAERELPEFLVMMNS